MKHIIDLTKNNFDIIDFREAEIIDLYCQNILPNELEFKVWGAILLLDPYWKHNAEFPDALHNANDMYVSGVGTVMVDNLIGGSIEVYAYDNIKDEINRTNTAKNCDGSNLVFRRKWNIDKVQQADEYLWECVISWPYGFCNLHLFSNNGKATFTFNSEDMVPADKYTKTPDLYNFKEHN